MCMPIEWKSMLSGRRCGVAAPPVGPSMLIEHCSGYDPSKLFQRKVNKRAVPDYYNVIKEPMALSIIKTKVSAKEYKSFSEFVRDFALVPHNAQVYNRQESSAYQDAL